MGASGDSCLPGPPLAPRVTRWRSAVLHTSEPCEVDRAGHRPVAADRCDGPDRGPAAVSHPPRPRGDPRAGGGHRGEEVLDALASPRPPAGPRRRGRAPGGHPLSRVPLRVLALAVPDLPGERGG